MPRPASDVRSRILTIVDRQLRRAGAREVTIESVAREAGCAKGLVHYHYRTKSSLYAAAAKHLLSAHEARWKDALQATKSGSLLWIFRFVNGRIAETWGVVDVFSQMKQLGLIPA